MKVRTSRNISPFNRNNHSKLGSKFSQNMFNIRTSQLDQSKESIQNNSKRKMAKFRKIRNGINSISKVLSLCIL